MLLDKGTQIIRTERLILRPFVQGDAAAIYQNWACDPEVTRYLSWQSFSDPAGAEAILQIWLNAYSSPDTYRWGIALKEDCDTVFGSIDVVRADNRSGQTELGYCLSRQLWGKGIMTEAVQAVVSYLFDCGYTKITAKYDTRNPGSGRVMKKCGMRFERFLHNEVDNQGKPCEMAEYILLKDE